MCSIPGLPTPGSEVPVLITRVNPNPKCGFVELWVNLDDGKTHVYEQMRAEIQIPKKKFNGSDGNPGDHCLVCISDTWHRARIVSIQNEAYNVFLIDQGQPHTTSGEALAWGPSDCFLLSPEIESCILANVLSLENNWPEKVTQFLNSLPGKKFKGLVQHVLMPDRIILLDIPVVSKHMCKGGVAKKIPVDEFKCLVLKCLHLPKGRDSEAFLITQGPSLNVSCQLEKFDQYFYPDLFADTLESVNVMEVNDPQNIFCKLLIFSKAVKILSEQLHQHYEESSDSGEVKLLTCGDPCAARGSNGRWHRSLLKQDMTSNGVVEVLHVDEGKTEGVPVGDIKQLHAKFLKMPVVTYCCSLEGVKDKGTEWTTDEVDYLKSLLLHQAVMARFDHHNISQDVYSVTLYAGGAGCINSCFIEKAGLLEQNGQSQPIPSSFLSSPGDKRCIDELNNVSVDGLEEEILSSTKNMGVSGRADAAPTSGTNDTHVTDGSEHSDLLEQSNGHLPSGFPSEVQNAHDDDEFTAGSCVNVNVSCIESLQKFWCQKTENADFLRVLMEDLQKHYASVHPQPILHSVFVARNPVNNMWCRAKILENHHSPVVEVRFIDYGQIGKVPLRDVRPIDPAFLRFNAQAFQCCLFNPKNPTNPTCVTWSEPALTEFQKLVDSGASSDFGLKCIVKAVTSDEEGVLLNIVDIETPSDCATKRCAQAEAQAQIPPQVQSDAYSYSTHNIEVGGKEKVWVTSSDGVNHFYCQLDRNFHLFKKVMDNVQQLAGQTRHKDQPLGLNSICLARYTDDQWYRGQIVEMSPKLMVCFVDYGQTHAINESDIRPFPTEASTARSVPVHAVPLGLSDVSEEVPQEVNQWFADCAIGHHLTISVVAKGETGKLLVELFDGPMNVNVEVREKISQMRQQKMTHPVKQTDQQLSKTSKHTCKPNEEFLLQELMSVSAQMKITEQNGMCATDELKMHSQSVVHVSSPEINHKKTSHEGRNPTLHVILEEKETALAETFIQISSSDSEVTQLSLYSCPEESGNVCIYKSPNVSLNKTEEVYASCIVGPQYFWCQYANTETLNRISGLAQEAGKALEDMMFSKTLGPGSPCLALFSSDEQWYRAQVIHRVEDVFHVVFIDYGNESDVDIKDVRPLPQSLLDMAPQAILCSLNGFEESKGSWDDSVYGDFYNLLVDKPLKLTLSKMKEDHSEMAVPQYTVEIECEGVVVNTAMQKYWKPVVKVHVSTENTEMETILQNGQTKHNMVHSSVSKGNINAGMYKEPNMCKNKMEKVYASCIVDPHFFWCQYANTEELNRISGLAQEAGKALEDMMFTKTLGPGSPCLALFSSDKEWYRAQVIHKVEDVFHVVFIDYGNESDVEIKDVRPLPQSLLDMAPQAFLCSLHGFNESKGSWDDKVCEDFHSLLVDKPLELTVFDMKPHSEVAVPQYAVEVWCEGVVVNAAILKYWKPVTKDCVSKENPLPETIIQDCQTKQNMAHPSVTKANMHTGMYKKPNISKNQTEKVYASCIVDPHFFWCQYANTDELNKVTKLAEEAGKTSWDMMFSKTLGPGSPCLALFSSDEQWYRAQVIHRVDDVFHVVFIDYGNESDVDINDVRSLPQSLLDMAPQAFLCTLIGFAKSKGSWADETYDYFYNLLVDKPLKLTMINMDNHSEIAVPEYAVQIECEDAVVNTLMEKYWKGVDTDDTLTEVWDEWTRMRNSAESSSEDC